MWAHGGTHRADDMRDAHERVINGHTEIVDREPVAAQDDKVAQCICVELDIPSDLVLDDNVLAGRHTKPVAERGALHAYKQHSMTSPVLNMLYLCKEGMPDSVSKLWWFRRRENSSLLTKDAKNCCAS